MSSVFSIWAFEGYFTLYKSDTIKYKDVIKIVRAALMFPTCFHLIKFWADPQIKSSERKIIQFQCCKCSFFYTNSTKQTHLICVTLCF